jgi:hypothetical protein
MAMKRITLVGACLVAAAFAISGLAASTASAVEPVFERVIVVPIKEGEKMAFTSASAKATLETVGKVKIVCLSSSGKGNITGPTAISMAVTFKGCEEPVGTKCTSTGALEGEVVVSGFEGKLGNLKSEATPGIALFQGSGHANDAEFSCGATTVKIFGGVVGPITPIGSVVTKLKLIYKETAGVQLFENLFGGSLDNLSMSFSGGSAVRTGLLETTTITLSEPLEIS